MSSLTLTMLTIALILFCGPVSLANVLERTTTAAAPPPVAPTPAPRPANGRCDTLLYNHGSICCPQCEAGSHVTRHCTLERGTNCQRCPNGTFTATPNGLSSCRRCQTCTGSLRVRSPCTSVSDAVCEPIEGAVCYGYDATTGNCEFATLRIAKRDTCADGFYRHGDRCCQMCPRGNSVREHCKRTFTSSTCRTCSRGTFLAQPNGVTECLTCRDCDPNKNLVVEYQCTRYRDTVCQAAPDFKCKEWSGESCVVAEVEPPREENETEERLRLPRALRSGAPSCNHSLLLLTVGLLIALGSAAPLVTPDPGKGSLWPLVAVIMWMASVGALGATLAEEPAEGKSEAL